MGEGSGARGQGGLFSYYTARAAIPSLNYAGKSKGWVTSGWGMASAGEGGHPNGMCGVIQGGGGMRRV